MINFFVLDEADRMLDMGFIHDIKRILPKLPKKKQTLFFSATMPKAIAELAKSILVNPRYIQVDPVSSTADTIQQKVYHVLKTEKKNLIKHIIQEGNMDMVLVFTRTKRGADRLAKILDKAKIPSAAIHGDKSQGARERALSEFKEGKKQVLVATDIAARGIDIDSLAYVINYDIPNESETYVHRIGRRGRAGASGMSISLVDIDERDIEKLIGKKVPVESNHPYPITDEALAEMRQMQKSFEGMNKTRQKKRDNRRKASTGAKPKRKR